MRYIIFCSLMMILSFMILSACGRKGDPIPPDKITIDTSRGGARR